ncbi:MAG TPA: ATP-binding protein [Candidatus Caccalectryoclostridium excrementigallinarum]|uniref:ATP-binding protein n=1 Tax=Candidatus Caccalectryoclostridium excrementigallinarum TaxID=2840710 RepID=A0A9D1SJV0_9FIRM|nr:ATP-binding protein [Candidatus Caccalectryoclostridium excrementigallinarum]
MKLFTREKYLKKMRGFYHDTEIIKVITGVRRSGKSCLMQMVREELLQSGVMPDNIIFLDLDSKAFRKVKTADRLEETIDSLSAKQGTKYLFIDEIQNVKDFEEVVNAFRGSGEYSIFITGSNSYLLSGELATKLTGRYVEFELFPLSFDEYLDMKAFLGKQVNANLQVELNNYLQEGGFPKALEYDDFADKRTYVRSVIDEIFEKDIKKRVKVRNIETFNNIRNFIINNFGATISVRSLQKAFSKSGMEIKRPTLAKYIEVLTQSKILYRCDRFDMKSKRALSGEKKYYLADISFYFATNTDNRINYGPALENIVYIYARSLDYAVSVGRIGKLECDFIMRDTKLDYSYVQVAYTISESQKTEDREYAPLESITDNYPKYVLTTDYLLQNRSGIKHVNLLEFMKSHSRF